MLWLLIFHHRHPPPQKRKKNYIIVSHLKLFVSTDTSHYFFPDSHVNWHLAPFHGSRGEPFLLSCFVVEYELESHHERLTNIQHLWHTHLHTHTHTHKAPPQRTNHFYFPGLPLLGWPIFVQTSLSLSLSLSLVHSLQPHNSPCLIIHYSFISLYSTKQQTQGKKSSFHRCVLESHINRITCVVQELLY